MADKHVKLTIAIPTYNRSGFLKRNLEGLLQQYDAELSIEIIVSDNKSTDDTQEIVKAFTALGLPIKYILNDTNTGLEANLIQCYDVASGDYVLVLGDDDMLMAGAINIILEKIEEAEYGIIYLVGSSFDDTGYNHIPATIGSKVYTSANKFINRIHFYSTFISSNVVNKKYYSLEKCERHSGTLLAQMGFIFTALLEAKKNVVIETPIIKAQEQNSGGYNLFNVFGIYLVDIAKKFSSEYNNKAMYIIIKNEVILKFIPSWIVLFRNNANTKFKGSEYDDLDKYYAKDILYKVTKPLRTLPPNLLSPFEHIVKLVRYVNKIYMYLIYR